MDGPHLNTRLPPRAGRHLLAPSRLDTPTSWLAFFALSLAITQMVLAADRPETARQARSRHKVNTASASDVPPAPAKREDKAESDVDEPAPMLSDEPMGESTSGGITKVANLRRFPQKSAGTRITDVRAIGDILTDLDKNVTPIDLPAALQLAGFSSPDVLLAQQRVLAVTARQQLAAAQALPNLNVGSNYDSHTGAVQQSSGALVVVQRSSLYVGAGGNAVGSGAVNIPGLQYNMNVGDAYFTYLASLQQSERSIAGAAAVRNNVLLQIAIAYCQLVRSQGTRAIALQVRENAAEVARITAAFAKIGQGLPADAERAVTELGQRDADIFSADALIIEASARLGQILNLESSVRLQSKDNWVIPRSVVPDPIPLAELIAIALYQRPEVAERRAEVHAAMLQLRNAQLLLFSPQFIADFSDGVFGGGSDVNTAATGSPRFGDFSNRTDADIIMYWSIRNMGLANRALIKTATARTDATNWERTQRLNQIRAEVADAYARTQASNAQLAIRHRAVVTAEHGLREDLQRSKAGEGRPIEVLDSLRLRSRTQQEYLDTITTYNQAQYELYVAIGQPPADLLIHPNPPTPRPASVKEPQ